MSQPQRNLTSDVKGSAGPSCCGRPTMLASIEPVSLGTDLRTYYCVVCATKLVVEVHYTNPTRKSPERQVR